MATDHKTGVQVLYCVPKWILNRQCYLMCNKFYKNIAWPVENRNRVQGFQKKCDEIGLKLVKLRKWLAAEVARQILLLRIGHPQQL